MYDIIVVPRTTAVVQGHIILEFISTLLSPLIPYGIHVEWIYSMESTWNPCGICTFHLAYMWIPHGFHMECTYSTWIPCGMYIFHMDSMWNKSIPHRYHSLLYY